MGESERYIDRRFKKISLGADSNSLVALISINAIGFILLGLIQVIYHVIQSSTYIFTIDVLPWFVMPAKLGALAKVPWTFLVYMFVHTDIIFTFTNLLWLWVFGKILQDIAGNDKVIPVYLYGGVAGAVFFIATEYAIPQLRTGIDSATLQGASASIMAVAIAATTIAPDYRFFRMLNGGIPIWVITILFVIVDFAGIGQGGASYHLAHIAGGVAGFVFVSLLRKGYDLSAWMNKSYDWFINLFNPDKKVAPQHASVKEKLFYKTGTQKPFVKRSIVTQQRIDEILDKINQKGYNLLSEEEKNILKRASESDF
ncbi:MAG: rhomboid family intramembrane serine protease [Ginsengibacter sp.]